jgi:hypothetical protein
MKKILLVFAVALLASPALATVTVTCEADGNQVTVKFTSNEPNKVRAFALDIFCTDANIIAGSVSDVNPDYFIHPGSFDVNESGVVQGTVVCDACYPGTQAGPGSSSMSTEQGSLYEIGVDPAPNQVDVVLFKFRVDGDCTVDINENTIRGGVVMENPDENPTVDTSSSCEVSLAACWPCYTLGDIAGKPWVNGGAPDGLVDGFDVTKLGSKWGSTSTDTDWDACLDVGGKPWINGGAPDGVIDGFDLTKLGASWGQTCATGLSGCCP